jgi:hypothetical protein
MKLWTAHVRRLSEAFDGVVAGCVARVAIARIMSGGAMISVNETAEDVDAFNARGGRQPGHCRDRGGGCNVEADAAARTGGVVVPQIVGEHLV